jgi:hypothetical protein
MTFTEALFASGYRFDDENYDDAWVKTDSDGFIHLYQEGEEESEWNYVKMTSDYDVISEVTFNPDSNFIV